MLAMHVDQPPRACAFVQVIDILSDDQQIPAPCGIEMPERPMRGIGLGFLDMLTAHVVETEHQIGIARKALGRRHVLDAVPLPQPAGVAKRPDSAFGGNSGTSQDHDIADVVHLTQ